jgi:hypothetical protein
MNNVRLVCGNQIVDLPTDFGILINKSIADIREPESRSSDWSKTFTLPGTKRNNKLFSHLFDLNLSIRNTTATNFNPDFNPNLKASASLYVDEVTQIEGFIRLLNINVTDRHEIQYECTLHGQLADLFAKIADAKLEDLDFSEYNHIMNDTNIFNSWDTSIVKNGSSGYVNFSGGAPIGDGYLYAWLDDGTYADYKNLNTDDMTICLYAKTVVDKIFSGAGYTYSSGSFFNTNLFKRVIVPCPTRYPIFGVDDVTERTVDVKRTSDASVTAGNNIIFNFESADQSNQYNTTTGVYTNDFSGIYDLFFINKATISGLTNGQTYIASYTLKINGADARYLITEGKVASGGSVTYDNRLVFDFVYLNDGDTVELVYEYVYSTTTNAIATGAYTQKTDSRFFNQIYDMGWGYGKTLDFAGFFTIETKQREFLKWIFTMFNLYIEPTEIEKTLTILPREEFYQSTVRDWTAKRDLLQPLEITPMGELDAGKYVFTYSEGDDDDNKAYKQEFDRNYGDRNIIINNDFIKEEKKIEIGFQPTMIIKPINELDKFFAGNSTENQDGKAGKLRILQYSKQTCLSYNIFLGAKTPKSTPASTTKTAYPFLGHIDTPLTSSVDLNFGMPKYIGLPGKTPVTNNNLYNAYWSKYIQEITDKDSKIVRGHFHLTPADIEKLSFRDLYFFDGNYFRLNKVEDYDPINPSVNICEFLFLKTGQTFTATTGSVGGGGEQGTGEETEYNPGGGRTNGKVIEQKGVSIGEYNSVGDGIGVGNGITNLGLRNTAFATSGVTFICNDSIVIGEAPAEPVGCNEVWIQGQQITPNNFNSNRFVYPANNYTLALHDDIIISLGTGNHTLTLPQASTATGKMYWVVKKGAQGTLTIDAYADELIDGDANYTINTHYGTACLVCDGTEWYALTNK